MWPLGYPSEPVWRHTKKIRSPKISLKTMSVGALQILIGLNSRSPVHLGPLFLKPGENWQSYGPKRSAGNRAQGLILVIIPYLSTTWPNFNIFQWERFYSIDMLKFRIINQKDGLKIGRFYNLQTNSCLI